MNHNMHDTSFIPGMIESCPDRGSPQTSSTPGLPTCAGTLLTARLNRQLQADSGSSMPEHDVLVHLSEAPGGRLRPFQLSSALHWEQSRLSHQLSRMARRRFIFREECPGDGRGALIVLTAAGRAAIGSAAPRHAAAVWQLVFGPLDDSQTAMLWPGVRSDRGRPALDDHRGGETVLRRVG